MFVKRFISNWLKKRLSPKPRCMYACLHGVYIGKMFVYIDSIGDNFNFLILPDMVNITMTFENFKSGIENKIIDKVTIIDKKYWQVCCEKFKKNIVDKNKN